jgi:hypothetical protein
MEQKRSRLTEDWLAVFTGLFIFALSLAVYFEADLLGWAVTTNVWTNVSEALSPVSKGYAGLPGWAAFVATYIFLLAVLTAGVKAIGTDLKRFAGGFTAVFFVSYLCWIAGSWAYIAATPNKLEAFGIPWSLNLTSEAGFILALVAGLLIGNFLPSWVRP